MQKSSCFLLGGQADGERVWRRDQQAHGGNQHVQTSGSSHQPLAALRVILQDALIAFQNSFLWCRTGWTVRCREVRATTSPLHHFAASKHECPTCSCLKSHKACTMTGLLLFSSGLRGFSLTMVLDLLTRLWTCLLLSMMRSLSFCETCKGEKKEKKVSVSTL